MENTCQYFDSRSGVTIQQMAKDSEKQMQKYASTEASDICLDRKFFSVITGMKMVVYFLVKNAHVIT